VARERPSSPDPVDRQREQLATFLVIALTILIGGSFVLFLIVVSLGLFLWVLVAGALIAVFTGLHYLIWGRSLPRHDSDADNEAARGVPPSRPRLGEPPRDRADAP